MPHRHPAFAVAILATAALRPILQPHLPCTDDIGFHLLRLTQLDALLRQGVLYSRWAPDMAQGYGFPLFNFYAPLSYYAAELVSLLAGNLNLGLRLTFALGMLGAGWMMYLLAREYVQPLAAIVAAIAYIYAPYHGYDVFFRGNLAESFAWWLLPLALWCMKKMVDAGAQGRGERKADDDRTTTPLRPFASLRLCVNPRWLAATAATYAAIILTHNVFALLFTPLLLAYGVAVSYQLVSLSASQRVTAEAATTNQSAIRNPQSAIESRLKPLLRTIFPLLLGLLLTAFFWFPALAERPLVYSDRLLIPPIFVYWGNFLTLGELLTPPQPLYPDLLNPSPPRALGWVQILLALPALAWAWHGRLRHPARFFLLATLVGAWLTLPSSQLVWEWVPLLEYVQFPWRLLGVVALTTAVLAGLGVDGLLERWPQAGQAIALLGIAGLIGSNLFWFSPRYCPGLAAPTVADIGEYERLTQTIGTTAKGEYVPRTAVEFPPIPSSGGFANLPPTAVLHQQTRTPLSLTANLTASEPFTLTAELFAYPGWVAQLNGRDVPLTPSPPYGLITLPVPTGNHHIHIFWREPTSRRLANALSLVAFLMLVGLTAAGRKREEANYQLPITNYPITNTQLLTFTLLSLLLTLAPAHLARPWLPRQPTAVATFQGGAELVNFHLSTRALPSDQALGLTIWWRAAQPLAGNYQTFVRLVGEDGQWWSSGESERPRVHRAFPDPRSWPPAGYAEDMHHLRPLPGTPPGQYHIELVLFDRHTLAAVPLPDGSQSYRLATIAIERPKTPPTLAPRTPLAQDWGAVRLLGYELDRTEAHVGDPLTLALFWAAPETPTADHALELRLRPSDGSAPPLRHTLPLASLPTSHWRAGDAWRGQYRLTLPPHLPSDEYTWEVAFCPAGVCGGDAPTAVLSSLRLTAPARLFSPPPMPLVVDESLGGIGRLAGATITPTPAGLTVELVWQALTETETRYKVFVQALDEAGQAVAVSDGEPAGWQRPTTSWLSGEYITDTHQLAIPEGHGRLTLIAGLYDPLTNTRLTTAEGGDVIGLGEVGGDE